MRRTEDGYLVILGELAGVVFDGLTTKPGRTIVAPGGEVAWDDCCAGQLAVRIVRTEAIYQSEQGGCPVGYRLVLGVSLVRCVATIDDNGRAPRAEQITLDGHNVTRDMGEVARAIQNYRPADAMRVYLGEWIPSGPQGGCAGGEWTLTIRTGSDL